MDIVNILPDEMWMKILDYLPLHDRLEWVQFTNKRLMQLTRDVPAVQNLDFHGCSNVSDDLCLKLINRSKDSVRFLSFRDCSWFSNQICTTLPRLKNLVTLDILGCFMSSETLHSLLRATRSIKRLALSTTETVMKDFCQLQSKRGLSLRVLHVELLHYPERLSSRHTRTVLKNFIKTCCHCRPHCISVQTLKHLPLYHFEDIFTGANLTVYRDSTQRVMRKSCDKAYYNQILIAVAFHRDGSPLSAGCLDGARVLCLPMLLSCRDFFVACYCKGQYMPRALHELEYLICSPYVCSYPGSAESVLRNCSIPKLTHLDLGKRCASHVDDTDAFYGICDKLPSFTNLVELNVCGMDLHGYTLLFGIMDLKHLSGLSFSLHLPILSDLDPEQDVRNFTIKTADANESCRYAIFLSKLVKNFPDLEKLEISCSMDARKCVAVSDLEPIGILGKLCCLSLHGFILDDVDQLAHILSKCTKISSLDLGHFETDVAHDFSECFSSLRHLIYLRLAHDDLESVSEFHDLHMSSNLQRFTLYSKSTLSAAWIESFLGPVVTTCDLFCMCHIECQNVDAGVKKMIAKYRKLCESKYRNNVVLSCSDDCIGQHPVCQSWQGRAFSSVATYSPFDFIKMP